MKKLSQKAKDFLNGNSVPEVGWFLKNSYGYPLWLNRKDKKKHSGTYITSLEDISNFSDIEMTIAKMFWNIEPFDKSLFIAVYDNGYIDDAFLANIPKLTNYTKAAIAQTNLALKDENARKEWADRLYGKSINRDIRIQNNTDENELEAIRKEIYSKFDLLKEG